MPKKQKRFKSEQAILKAIDVMEERRLAKYIQAEELEASVKSLSSLDFPSDEEWNKEKDYRRKMAGMARRSAQRAASKKVELGKALSAMRTMLLPMPFNNDTSVTL